MASSRSLRVSPRSTARTGCARPPISEQAIIGAGVGAAIAGYKPVAEIMMMNFLAVCLDQVNNHAAKLRYMTGGQTTVPMVIRNVRRCRPGLRRPAQRAARVVVRPHARHQGGHAVHAGGRQGAAAHRDLRRGPGPVRRADDALLVAQARRHRPRGRRPDPARQGRHQARRQRRHRDQLRQAGPRLPRGRGDPGCGRDLGRGGRPAHADAVGRGGRVRLGRQDQAGGRRARGGHPWRVRRGDL